MPCFSPLSARYLLCLFLVLSVMTRTTEAGIEDIDNIDTDPECKFDNLKRKFAVFGIGIFFLDLHDVNIVQGTFFSTYQLTIFKRVGPEGGYSSQLEAEQMSMNTSNRGWPKCLGESSNGNQWRPWTEGKANLLLSNRKSNDFDFDPTDSKAGRYLFQGANYFLPNYLNVPFEQHNLTVNMELKNPSKQSSDPGPPTSVLFCAMDEYGGLAGHVVKRLEDVQTKNPASAIYQVSITNAIRRGTQIISKNKRCIYRDTVQQFRAYIQFEFKNEKEVAIGGGYIVVAMALAGVSYFMPKNCGRISLVTSALIGLATQHQGLSLSFPYVSWIDYLAISAYFVLGVAIFHTIAMAWFDVWYPGEPVSASGNSEKKENVKLHVKATLCLGFGMVLVILLIILVSGYGMLKCNVVEDYLQQDKADHLRSYRKESTWPYNVIISLFFAFLPMFLLYCHMESKTPP